MYFFFLTLSTSFFILIFDCVHCTLNRSSENLTENADGHELHSNFIRFLLIHFYRHSYIYFHHFQTAHIRYTGIYLISYKLILISVTCIKNPQIITVLWRFDILYLESQYSTELCLDEKILFLFYKMKHLILSRDYMTSSENLTIIIVAFWR